MKGKIFLFLLVGLILFLSGLQPTQAIPLPVIFELNYEYGGGTPPAGSSPWLTATFSESPANPDFVRLTMAATNLTDKEFISGWWFNFNDAVDHFADLLDVDLIDTAAVGGPTGIAFTRGENFDKAGPDGKFDLLFQFPTANRDTNRFTRSEQVIVDIKFLINIDPKDFYFESEPGKEAGDKGPFFSAAHIQGIGPSGSLSGWIAPNPRRSANPVPESSTLLLLGIGLIGLAGFGRKRFKT